MKNLKSYIVYTNVCGTIDYPRDEFFRSFFIREDNTIVLITKAKNMKEAAQKALKSLLKDVSRKDLEYVKSYPL